MNPTPTKIISSEVDVSPQILVQVDRSIGFSLISECWIGIVVDI